MQHGGKPFREIIGKFTIDKHLSAHNKLENEIIGMEFTHNREGEKMRFIDINMADDDKKAL